MTGSIYFTNGTTTVNLKLTDITEQLAKELIIYNIGQSPDMWVSGAKTSINDFHKQTRIYMVNGDILPSSGSSAWQLKNALKNMIEAGGTFQFCNGSDGTFTGNVGKSKFVERGGTPNRYEASIEFTCGSSR